MIRVIKGDITKVTGFDAIVNPANNSLLGGGGLDGIIHRVAGPQLKTECRKLNGCETGDSKLTLGYNLPCEYVIHSVGPIWMGGIAGEAQLLASCYTTALKVALSNHIRKIAFASISTGEYGYPLDKAAKLAVATVSSFVASHPDAFDDICWVLQDDLGFNIYSDALENAEPVKKAEPKKKPGRKGKKGSAKDDADEDIDEELTDESGEDSATNASSETISYSKKSKNKNSSDNSENENITSSASKDNDAAKGKKDANSDSSGVKDDITADGKSTNRKTTESSKTRNDSSDSDASSSLIAQSIPELASPEMPPDFPGALYNKYHIDWLIDEVANGNPHSYVCFFLAEKSNEFCQFSLWYQGAPIFINGRKYTSAQQYISAEKALLFNDFDTYAKIMNEADPAICQKLGCEIKNFDEVIWKKCYREVIFNCNVGKFLSDKAFADALTSTGDAVIIEASPVDDILGAGIAKESLLSSDGALKIAPQNWHKEDSDYQAKNELGFILMAVREFFFKK